MIPKQVAKVAIRQLLIVKWLMMLVNYHCQLASECQFFEGPSQYVQFCFQNLVLVTCQHYQTDASVFLTFSNFL